VYNIILVPLDGSQRAQTILPYVEELARGRESKVIFLQVIEPSMFMAGAYDTFYYDTELAERIIAATKSYLTALVDVYSKKGLVAKSFVEQGPVVQTILDVAEREQADLIAMASHGRTGLARVFYGSVAAGILHQADRPLLLVRSSGTE
jgi:nucleotide-binding universal stress UspA family protein